MLPWPRRRKKALTGTRPPLQPQEILQQFRYLERAWLPILRQEVQPVPSGPGTTGHCPRYSSGIEGSAPNTLMPKKPICSQLFPSLYVRIILRGHITLKWCSSPRVPLARKSWTAVASKRGDRVKVKRWPVKILQKSWTDLLTGWKDWELRVLSERMKNPPQLQVIRSELAHQLPGCSCVSRSAHPKRFTLLWCQNKCLS